MGFFFYNNSKGLNNAKKLTNNINLKYKREEQERYLYCNRDKKTNNNKRTCKNNFPIKFKNIHKNLIKDRDNKLNKAFIFYKNKVFSKLSNLCDPGIFGGRIKDEDITILVNYINKLIDANNYKIEIQVIKKECGFNMNTILSKFKKESRYHAEEILLTKKISTFKQNHIKLILKELKSILDILICKV